VVIVGGGLAGCVLAAKLSEDGDRRVLVLEAGPAYTAASLPESIRLLSQALLPEHDWAHEADSAGRRIPYTRGKVVGGSSAVNATMAFRPSPADVDGWGVDGWSWDDLLPHLVAVERDLQFGARPWHGDAGPLPITRFADDELTGTQAWFAERCRELGAPVVDDHNDPATAGGVGAIPMNRSGRERVSAADAFLYPALDRPNLEVRGGAHVDRVVLDGRRAVGVEVAGERVGAGEVVLCGGVIQTPLLLWRSGVDHPAIGTNLSDHPSVPVTVEVEPAKGPTVQVMLRTDGLDLMVFPTTGGVFYASPQSVDVRGRVHPDGRIDWPFLDDPRCMDQLRDGVRRIVDIAEGRAQVPEDVDAHIREAHGAFLDGCGTCALGEVVDPDLRVVGHEGLRVCDTSIIPTVPRANPALTMFGVAHRAADLFGA